MIRGWGQGVEWEERRGRPQSIVPFLAGYAYSGEALMMDVAEGVSFKALDKLPPEASSPLPLTCLAARLAGGGG